MSGTPTFSTPRAAIARITAVTAAFFALAATAQEYPNRPIQVIVPYTAGGNTDVMARGFLEVLQKTSGISSIVVNRDGAGGTVGFAQLLSARPDGYTLVFAPNSALSSAPHLMKSLPFSMRDFIPVCGVFENIFAIAVAPNSKYATLQALVEDARRRPEEISFGTAGIASVGHLAGAAFARELGLKLTHVPFRGDGQVMPQVLGGQIDVAVNGIGSAAGTLRPLAVFSDQRIPFLPSVPTTAELGLPSSPPGYQGLFAPRQTPPTVVARLEKACEVAVNAPEFGAFAARQKQKVAYKDSATFGARIAEDYEYKGRIIKQLGIQPE